MPCGIASLLSCQAAGLNKMNGFFSLTKGKRVLWGHLPEWTCLSHHIRIQMHSSYAARFCCLMTVTTYCELLIHKSPSKNIKCVSETHQRQRCTGKGEMCPAVSLAGGAECVGQFRHYLVYVARNPAKICVTCFRDMFQWQCVFFQKTLPSYMLYNVCFHPEQ